MSLEKNPVSRSLKFLMCIFFKVADQMFLLAVGLLLLQYKKIPQAYGCLLSKILLGESGFLTTKPLNP